LWELSCILRAPTVSGDVWFKASRDSPLFVNEAVVARELAGLFPDHVPAPLAVDAERRWMAMADFGRVLGWDAPVEVREDVLATFARLQIRAASQVDRLLGAGCVDRRLAWLAAQAERWLPAVAETGWLPGIDAATWLSAGEEAELAAAGPRLAAMCGELAAAAVPATLLHGDLHLGNVAKGPDGYLFLDWTDAYLAEWTRFAPQDTLRRAWEPAEPLGALHHALSYRSIVANLDPPIDPHMMQSTAFWLRGEQVPEQQLDQQDGSEPEDRLGDGDGGRGHRGGDHGHREGDRPPQPGGCCQHHHGRRGERAAQHPEAFWNLGAGHRIFTGPLRGPGLSKGEDHP
jgi:hypothetical protein